MKPGDLVWCHDEYKLRIIPDIGVVIKVFLPKVHVLLPNGKIEWRQNYDVEVIQ